MGNRASRTRRILRSRARLAYRPGETTIAYHCPSCGQATYTALTDPGTPPDTIRCLTTRDCPGHARTDHTPTTTGAAAQWEWHTPTTADMTRIRTQGGPLWQHVEAGGMLLRHRPTR